MKQTDAERLRDIARAPYHVGSGFPLVTEDDAAVLLRAADVLDAVAPSQGEAVAALWAVKDAAGKWLPLFKDRFEAYRAAQQHRTLSQALYAHPPAADRNAVVGDDGETVYTATHLKLLLDGRDQFIVEHGLWSEFVESIPAEARANYRRALASAPAPESEEFHLVDGPAWETERERKLRGALIAMRAWLGVMADAMDWDVGETCVTINAVGPNGKRELAKRSLAEINAQADAALAPLTPEGDKT